MCDLCLWLDTDGPKGMTISSIILIHMESPYNGLEAVFIYKIIHCLYKQPFLHKVTLTLFSW